MIQYIEYKSHNKATQLTYSKFVDIEIWYNLYCCLLTYKSGYQFVGSFPK